MKHLPLIFLKKWSWHTHDHMSICGLQLEINNSGPILVFFLNLSGRNVIGIYLSIFILIWCKLVHTFVTEILI